MQSHNVWLKAAVNGAVTVGPGGAFTIPELHERAEFIQISGAGYQESHAHDVLVRA